MVLDRMRSEVMRFPIHSYLRAFEPVPIQAVVRLRSYSILQWRNKLNEFPERSEKEKAMKFHRFIFAERGGLATSLLIVASLYAFPLPRRRAPCKKSALRKELINQPNFVFTSLRPTNEFVCVVLQKQKDVDNIDISLLRFIFAERGGFEPPKPFWGLLAFQAGQFNHSCISPFLRRQR